MNTLATQSGSRALGALNSLKSGLTNVASTLPPKSGGEPFLRLEKSGDWVFGADSVQVEDGSLWAINPFSLQHGYACWTRWEDYTARGQKAKKNELMGETMVSMQVPIPDRSKLREYPVDGHPDDAWDYADQLAFEITCVSGDDAGTKVLYKTTSKGGIDAIRVVIDKIMNQLDNDPERPVPVIELQSTSYTHKSYGKVVTPVLDIKQWATLDQTEVEDTDSAAAAEQETLVERAVPTGTKVEHKRTAKPKVEPEAAGPDEGDGIAADAGTVGGTHAVSAEERRAALLAELAAMDAGESPVASRADGEGAVRRRRRA